MAVRNPQLARRPLKWFLPLLLQYIIFDFLLPGAPSDETRQSYRSDDARDTVAAVWCRIKKHLSLSNETFYLPTFDNLQDDAPYFFHVFEHRFPDSSTPQDECPAELADLLKAVSQRRECDKEMLGSVVDAATWLGQHGRWPGGTILAELAEWVKDVAPRDADM
ncbi:hypothetical protein AK830_g7474 [Neonectria ditissima]|uniref:Uncharacterized protein n=1 Tax=Neonectria ditissima TaxID=78410 RepID=A0A0P7BDS6_9HYPO|nr:hypothetical protein AK830_g7474 [Neonectria ditissima]